MGTERTFVFEATSRSPDKNPKIFLFFVFFFLPLENKMGVHNVRLSHVAVGLHPQGDPPVQPRL